MIPKNVSFNPQRNLKRFFQQLVVVVVYIIQFTVGILANIVVILVLALSPQAKRFRKNTTYFKLFSKNPTQENLNLVSYYALSRGRFASFADFTLQR